MANIINVNMLLVLVQEKPEIWDQRDANYANRARIEAAWRSICGILFPEYDQRPREVQNQMMEDVMRRWCSIRDQYSRERQQRARSGSATPAKKRKYIYYDRLSFLDPSMYLRPTQSNLTERETSSDSEAIIDLVGEEVAGPSSHPSSVLPPATSSVATQDPATSGQETAAPPTAAPHPGSQEEAGNSSSPTVPLETSPQPAVISRRGRRRRELQESRRNADTGVLNYLARAAQDDGEAFARSLARYLHPIPHEARLRERMYSNTY